MTSKYQQKVLKRKHEVKLNRQVISETLIGSRVYMQQVVYTGSGTSITKHERVVK